MNWTEKLQHIDSRYLYILLALVIAIPLVFKLNLPIVVSPATRGAYDTVENMPSNKIALISIDWARGTAAENQPQTEVLIRHLFMRHKKFAIIAFDIQGNQLAMDIASRISKEMGRKYGIDWVDWGFQPPSNMVLIVQGLARNIQKQISHDIHGTPLSKIPVMNGIKDIHDIGFVAEITPSSTLDIWIAFIHGPYRTPLIYATTSVSIPEGFMVLDSGQISGMLGGMKGAAEYEKLLGRSDKATMGASALSSSHLLIIAMIILGNIGYISSRRRKAATQR
jgi:hypothetical protein